MLFCFTWANSNRAPGASRMDAVETKLKRVRIALFLGICWFILFIVLPGAISEFFNWGERPAQWWFDTLSIVFTCSLTLYLVVQIVPLVQITFPIVTGTALLAISAVYFADMKNRSANATMSPLDSWPHMGDIMGTFNDLGLVLLIGGLLFSMIELLRTRHIALVQQQQLQEEMDNRIRIEAENEEYRLHMMIASRMSILASLASGIGHEIKNPLMLISATCQQLEMELTCETPDLMALNMRTAVIRRSADRIDRIVRSLYNLSQGKEVEPTAPVAIKSILSETLELCQARFRNHSVALEISSVPEDLQIECRPTEISQVFLNLLGNAFDAVTTASEKWVRIEVSERDAVIEVAFIDSGPGIPPEICEKIFRPYVTTKPLGEGMGIGLSISKRIIDAHGGELYLDPESSHTRFVVRIPRAQRSDEEKSAPIQPRECFSTP